MFFFPKVYLHYVKQLGNAYFSPVYVTNSDKTDRIDVNQNLNDNSVFTMVGPSPRLSWVLLGIWNFQHDAQKSKRQLRLTAEGADGWVVADAVKTVRIKDTSTVWMSADEGQFVGNNYRRFIPNLTERVRFFYCFFFKTKKIKNLQMRNILFWT